MVKVDIGIKEIIGLVDGGFLEEDKFKKYLESFEKKDFIEYFISEYGKTSNSGEDDEDDTKKDDDDDV